jgi:hypothetical protein
VAAALRAAFESGADVRAAAREAADGSGGLVIVRFEER